MKRRQGALSSIWEMTLSERKNVAYFLEHTTARPFIYCRYFYKCFFCNENYSDVNTLLHHSLNHQMPEHDIILKALLPKGKRTVKVDISTLKCKICKQDFNDLDETRRHLVTDHGIPFTESGNGIVAYNLTMKEGQYECHICNKICQTFILLNRHMNVHFNNAVCETCGAGFMTYQRLLQHKETHVRGGFACNKCDKVYTTSSNLKFHKEKAHEGLEKTRMLRCPHCHERFSEHFKKLKHLEDVHAITFTFECDHCKSVFPSRRALTMHSNKVHLQKTRCKSCHKTFSSVSTLKKHMAVRHAREKCFACSLCQKTFRQEKSLKEHMDSHFQTVVPVEYSYTCSECGNGFFDKDEYKKHVVEWHPWKLF